MLFHASPWTQVSQSVAELYVLSDLYNWCLRLGANDHSSYIGTTSTAQQQQRIIFLKSLLVVCWWNEMMKFARRVTLQSRAADHTAWLQAGRALKRDDMTLFGRRRTDVRTTNSTRFYRALSLFDYINQSSTIVSVLSSAASRLGIHFLIIIFYSNK